MSERLKTLMKVADPYYSSDSPLLLEAFALYQDTETGRNVAQLKWANLGTKRITAVMVDLNCFDAFNQKKETVSYQYTVVKANQNDEFGSKTAIQIKSSVVTRYEVLLKGIAFENGEIWKPTQIEAFTPLPAKNPQALTDELLQQYKRDLAEANIPAEAAVYMPRKHSGLWQCGCGNWQLEGDECCLCHCTYEQLQTMYSTETLQAHLTKYNEDLRIAKEKQQEEERLKKEKERLQAIARAEKQARSAKITKRVIIGLISAFAIFMVLFNLVIPSIRYNNALQSRAAGQFDKARAIFIQLDEFKDAAQQVYATYYAQGEYLRAADDWNGAITAFTNAGSYSDAANQVTETHYQHAKALMGQGSYDAAFAKFSSIKGYKDVDNLLASDHNLLVAAFEAAFQPGEYISFGHYPQTTAGNDNTPIEWLVLARDGRQALLLSRYSLDAKPYNTQYTSITWEQCTLRKWLNNDFLNKAFSSLEQDAIVLTNVDNSKSQGYNGYNTNGGNNTQDKVFLLSYAEANKFLGVTYDDSKNTKSRVELTAYAINQGASTSSGDKAGWWWLRSPGYIQRSAAYVNFGGSLNFRSVDHDIISVRPALCVDIDLVAPFATYGK